MIGNDKKDYWKKFVVGPEILPSSHLKIFESNDLNIRFSLEPIKVITMKDNKNLFFRTFSFVDKIKLYALTDFIDKHKDIIGKFLYSVNNHENISQYQIVEKYGNKYEFVNFIELKAIGINSKKTYERSIIDEISRSSIFKYRKNIDVSKFYDSIYTHSLEWIENKEILSISKKLDKLIKESNGNITNGIPTGPISSKVISEILLTSVMLELNKKKKNTHFHIYRFADDFTIYYDEEEDFNDISKSLALILNKYKLSINKEKLENNYSYRQNAMKDINIYEKEGKYNILYNKLKIKEDSIDKSIIRAKSIILNTISSIHEEKEKASFYKWILKTWNNEKNFNIIKQDEDLINIFMDIAINHIVISDLSLNIPLNFLKILLEIEDKEIKYKYFKKLQNLYLKTDSQMKKIFIFEFLYTANKINYITQAIKDGVDRYIKNEWFLHLAQILESKYINFEKNILNKIDNPKFSNKRLSKEWVLWIYASKKSFELIKDKEIRSKIIEIKKLKKYVQPFSYKNK